MADAKKTDKPKEPEAPEAAIGGTVPPSEPVASTAESYPHDAAVNEDITPPKGAYIEDLTGESGNTTQDVSEPRAPAFGDEFHGKGGRYIIDAETGERKEVFEKYLDADGEAKIRKAL